jgi:hypothetical protein
MKKKSFTEITEEKKFKLELSLLFGSLLESKSIFRERISNFLKTFESFQEK